MFNLTAARAGSIILVILASGCGKSSAPQTADPSPSAARAPAVAPVAAGQPNAAATTSSLARLVGRENWDVYFIGDARVGYGSVRWQKSAEDQALITAEGTLHLDVKRFGQVSQMDVRTTVLETDSGVVHSFAAEMNLGAAPRTIRGTVEGNTLQIIEAEADRTFRSSLPWKAGSGGFFALDESLACQPMQAGETRTLSALVPVVNQVANLELRAVALESTALLDGSRELLRIETVTRLLGNAPLAGTIWTDAQGDVLKTLTAAMNQVTFRTTKEVALRSAAGTFDLGDSSVVPVARPIEEAHAAKRIRYRVRLADGDPTEVFASDLGQRLVKVDGHTAELEVQGVRPDSPPAPTTIRQAEPTDDDRRPSALVESDDPRIVAMAGVAAGNERDPWTTAVSLERYVHRKITAKNFSQTFASAAQVAEALEGDCTEHAVLLAALARARGIPARVAIGLVYMPSAQAFGFHMWTEVYVTGRWIGIDGTLGQGGSGATHLKLATSSLKDATAFSSFLPVAQVLGKLKIEVLDRQ